MKEDIEEKLREIGWFPGRDVGDSVVEKWIHIGRDEFGAHIFPRAIRFIREFAGLRIGDIHFDLQGSYIIGEPSLLLLSEWLHDEILFPIGYEEVDCCNYMITPKGQIYRGGIATAFCADVEDFFANLLTEKSSWTEAIAPSWSQKDEKEFNFISGSLFTGR